MVYPELEELTWLAVHGRGVINTAHASQIALTLSQAGVSAGREAAYYMRYDDSPERVQLPFITYAVLGKPDIKTILPEEVDPVGGVFDALVVLDSSILIKSTSQRSLLLDGAKRKAALVVNTSLGPEVVLKLVKRYGCAQDWEGKIVTVRAKRYHQNIALGAIGALAKAIEPEVTFDNIVETLYALGNDEEKVDAVRRAYEDSDPVSITLRAEDCEPYRLKSSLAEKRSRAPKALKPWDRERYVEIKSRAAEAPTYELRFESMPRWEEMAPGLVEFGPEVGERNIGFKTSFARTFRPVIDEKKCVDCKMCHVFCPDGAIDHDPIRIDYDYCKGCGICARVCGPKAISMPHELKVLEDLDEEEFLTIREALIEYAY
jgi:pyruvate ferredoxin oxidoreductase delta subunit